MFGFLTKKDSPPPRHPSSFVNHGNPIHQAILGIKSGDSSQVESLLVALGDNLVILPMAEIGNLATGAALMFGGMPHLQSPPSRIHNERERPMNTLMSTSFYFQR